MRTAENAMLGVRAHHLEIDFDFRVRPCSVAGIKPLTSIFLAVAADVAVVRAEDEGIAHSLFIDLSRTAVEKARHRSAPIRDEITHQHVVIIDCK